MSRAASSAPHTRRGVSVELQKLLVAHLWACVPFGLVWAIWPDVFGRSQFPGEISTMRALYLLVFASLVARTLVLFRRPAWRWPSYAWPLFDVGFITAAIVISDANPDSWVVFLYALPIIQAAATLDLRWTLFVALLSAALCGAADGFEHARYTYFAFRLFLLVLVASMFTLLARAAARAESRLAISEYRNSLASEIHDGLQQYLGAIAMRLGLARSLAESDPKRAVEVASGQEDVARQASDELRLMVWRLRSSLSGGEGLRDTLERQRSLCADRCPAQVRLSFEGRADGVDPKVEHALLRIVQEALTNAAKHSGASRIDVRVGCKEDRIEGDVSDDGRGFDAGSVEAESEDHFGLQSLRARAEALGGECAIESSPGEGTVVRFRLPLRASVESETRVSVLDGP